MEKKSIIKNLEDAEDVFKEHRAVAAYLFGSTARGEDHEDSDIDVGVLFKQEPDIKTLVSLKKEITESTGLDVDISSLNQDDILFLHDIITEGILIYESDRQERVDFEVEVDRRYHDLKPLIEEHWRERRKRVLAHA